ncbi:glycosyltransferase family 9 protein [Streptomyces sp. B6B3]|uniref:glycosyltransferase family 9 protein n=1 Tax=Streptomyces sp. B6B3 TaxID=3153570 RepID=UPI00325F381A
MGGAAERVVVLRALGLGDLLAAVPALRGLRRGLPGHRLLLAAPAWLAPVAALTGAVDELLPAAAPGRAVPARIPWTGPPPEHAVDLHGSGPASLVPLRALRPRRLYGYAHPDGPRWRPEEHERDCWCRLLAWYGLPADPADVRIAAPAEPSPAPDATVLHPGADAAARRWPAERFAAVARELRAAGRPIVLTAGPGEEPLARRVAALAGLPPGSVVSGLSLPRLAALVAGAAAVVAGDTGVAHLATAFGTPSVVLFGPVAPHRWGPPRTARHRVLWHPGAHPGGRPGDPHGRTPDPRLLRIAPAEVLAALAALPAPWQVRAGPPP